jgi:hypothetical protein
METKDRLSRLGPFAAAAFVVLELGGVAIGSQPMVTISDSPAKIVRELGKHASTGAWIGAYMELASLAALALFAAWLFQRCHGARRAGAMLATGALITLTTCSLATGDVIRYGSHHGLGRQAVLTLFDLQSGLYIASWAATAAFLALAPVTGWLRRTAVGLAALIAVAVAVPTAGWAQLPVTASYLWFLVAGVSLAVGARRALPVTIPQAELAGGVSR